MRRPDLRKLRYSSEYVERPKDEPIGVTSIAFGIATSVNSFSAEWELLARGTDGLAFEDDRGRGRNCALVLSIQGQTANRQQRIVIEVPNITRVEQSSGGKSFFLHLRIPPRFEVSDGGGPDRRWKQAPSFNEEHARVAPYASKLVRIKVRDSREVDVFRERAQRRGLPRILSAKINLQATASMGRATLDKLAKWIRALEIPVAFQIEKLARNGLVDPSKLLGLRKKVEDILLVQGTTRTERILVLFADSLVRLEELGEERTKIEVVLSDDEGEVATDKNARPKPKPSKKRAREDSTSPLVPDGAAETGPEAPFEDRTDLNTPSEDEDDDVILPVSFLPAQLSRLHSPHELSGAELVSLLDHAVTRSVAFASLYSSVDPAKLRNEDGTLLDRDAHDIIGARFDPLFRGGFELGGGKWRFFGWSASALKSGACFFVSPFEKDDILYTPEVIHRDIGDFSGDPTARIVAKYFARISQAFTSSRPSIELREDQITTIPDISSSSGSLFSDGVGTISPDLALQVVGALDVAGQGKERDATCFQIRIGGAKGMLQVDPSLPGKKIALRPSQIKFKSNLKSLEIASVFPVQTGFLNRPLIKLLEDLKVPTDALFKLQKAATEKVRKSRKKLSSAIRLLEEWNLAPSAYLAETLAFLARDSKTSRATFRNPFVSQLLDATVVHSLRDMKHKARIPVPGCYNLVGVTDISNTLKEGEIYAQLRLPDGTLKCLEGEIAISRSPTNHPGDLRRVTAIGKLPGGQSDRIRHLVDCVVFSAKGRRSLPSMLAGGDLDGDLYLLLTQESGLVPEVEHISAPAAYDAAEPKKIDQDATLEDGIDFFFEYSAKDLTAIVATRQLHLADFYPEGLCHSDCLKLAQLHSDCVDYVKSGRPVAFDEVPRVPHAMKERGGRPDFASLPGGGSYASPKALGQLYRAIDSELIRPPTLDISSVDPQRSLTKALLSLRLVDGSQLPPKPRRELVDHFKTYLKPFSSELGKLADLCNPPAKEEELYLNVLVKNKIERSDKHLLSNRGERVDALFALVRQESKGAASDREPAHVRAWAEFTAAVEADEDHATRQRQRRSDGSEDKGKFGLRSWAFLALSVLEEASRDLKTPVDVIIID